MVKKTAEPSFFLCVGGGKGADGGGEVATRGDEGDGGGGGGETGESRGKTELSREGGE